MRSFSTPFRRTPAVATTSALAVESIRSFFGPFKKKKPEEKEEEEEGASQKKDDNSKLASMLPSAPAVSPVGMMKDVWKVTKAARQMSKEVPHKEGLGGKRDAFMDSQLAQMKAVIELQRKMAKDIEGKGGVNAPMAKMMAQSSDIFDKMLSPIEKNTHERHPPLPGAPSTEDIGKAAAEGKEQVSPEQLQRMREAMEAMMVASSSASSSQQQQQGNTPTIAEPGTQQQQQQQSASSSSSSTKTSASSSSGSGSGSGSGLPPEIEALFNELSAIKKKKNEYRDRYRTTEKQLQASKQSLSVSQASESDLRKRLSGAEHMVTLLKSETMDLKQKKDDLTAQLKKANTELMRVQPSSAAAASKEQTAAAELAHLKKQNSELSTSVERLERKLRRLRRHSAIGDLSELLSDMSHLGTETHIPLLPAAAADSSAAAAAEVGAAADGSSSVDGSSSSSSGDADDLAAAGSDVATHSKKIEFRNSVANDAFNSVRDKYEKALSDRFPADSRECGAPAALASVALELCRSRLHHALLDCIVTVPAATAAGGGGLKQLQELCRDKGWSVEPVTSTASTTGGSGGSGAGGQGDVITVIVAEKSDSATPETMGPYGYLAAYAAVEQQRLSAVQRSSGGSSSGSSCGSAALLASVSRVHPYVSSVLVNNSKRAKIVTDKARSSKPGGQAANVGETKITHRLIIDGMLVASAVSQDSRSAKDNTVTAMDRLVKERVPAVNQRLKRIPVLRLPPLDVMMRPSGSTTTTTGTSGSATGTGSSVVDQQIVAPTLLPILEDLELEQGELDAAAVKFALTALKSSR